MQQAYRVNSVKAVITAFHAPNVDGGCFPVDDRPAQRDRHCCIPPYYFSKPQFANQITISL
ncbi:MAG: hypothetical protein V7K21_21515 [Nostoc sp.]|uniref:hypothetical protein n=1 Tax=Nostoc sp. TaxID=1180 RepID=UPI002FF51F90